MLFIIPTVLLTDMVRYKPTLITQGLGYLLGYAFLLGAASVGSLQFVEFLFGIGWALGVGHLSYGFACLQSGLYKKIAAYVRGYLLMGKALSAVIGQVIVSTSHKEDMEIMNALSLSFVIISVLFLIFLPGIPKQKFVVTSSGIVPIRSVSNFASSGNRTVRNSGHSDESNRDQQEQVQAGSNQPEQVEASPSQSQLYQSETANILTEDQTQSDFTEIEDIEVNDASTSAADSLSNAAAVLQLNANALNDASDNDPNINSRHSGNKGGCCSCFYSNFYPLWQDFSRSYSSSYVFKWSLWWAVLTGVYIQVTWYSPQLWKVYEDSDSDREHVIRKGSVEAVTYFVGMENINY